MPVPLNGMYFEANKDKEGGAGGEKPLGDAGKKPAEGDPKPGAEKADEIKWPELLAKLPVAARAAYEVHTAGLKSALQSERDGRSDLVKEMKEVSKKLEEGSEAKTAVERVTGELEKANQRADFMEEGAKPEIGCSNLSLAWIAATEKDLFDKRGHPLWDQIKEQFPELFGKPKIPKSGAGAGEEGDTRKGGFDDILRRAAGRG